MSEFTRRHFVGLTTLAALGATVIPCLDIAADEAVCHNHALLDALKVLHRACTPIRCNFAELRTLDDARYRDALLAAFANRDLNVVHDFFPYDVSELQTR